MQNDERTTKANSIFTPDSALGLHPSAFPRTRWPAWAVFLGMSWTWCIGMYLPVILVRDYGVWAWIIFAIPNVVGAAAMGWVLDCRRSQLMVAAHRPAMTTFSAVTVAFQIFFAVWVFSRPPWQSAGGVWYLLGLALVAARATLRKSARLMAVLLLFASIACALGMFHDGEARFTEHGTMVGLSLAPPTDLVCLAPVCLLGFVLCPYLDTTFHRARQHTDDREARLSFTVGFGVIFCSAIVLSLLYAKPVDSAMTYHSGIPVILRWIKVYWMLQLGFTIGVHLVGDDTENHATRAFISRVVLVTGIALALAALAGGEAMRLRGETVYRCFLGFYGLVFPAYVYLCVIPGKGVVAPSRRAIIVFAMTVAIASPLFGEAFLGHRLIWAGPGVAIVLLAWLFLPKSARSPFAQSAPFLAQQNSAPTS